MNMNVWLRATIQGNKQKKKNIYKKKIFFLSMAPEIKAYDRDLMVPPSRDNFTLVDAPSILKDKNYEEKIWNI